VYCFDLGVIIERILAELATDTRFYNPITRIKMNQKTNVFCPEIRQ
jgi:hypothetical protein